MLQYLLPVIIILISVGLLFIRTNAAVVFFALCGGYTLSKVAGEDITLVANSFRGGELQSAIALCVATVLPALVLALFLRYSMKVSQLVLQIVPAIACGLFGTLMVAGLLPASAKTSLVTSTFWSQLQTSQSPIVLIGVLSSSLVAVVTLHKKSKHETGKRGREH